LGLEEGAARVRAGSRERRVVVSFILCLFGVVGCSCSVL
jgi:hypothetical protein